MAVIHAEDARLNREVIRQTDNAGALENVARCRPWFSETAAVQRSVFMGQITRGPIYFEHLGAGPSLDAVGWCAWRRISCLRRDLPTLSLLLGRDLSHAARCGISQIASFEKEREDCESLWEESPTARFLQWPRTSH